MTRDEVFAALLLAIERHDGQRRKGVDQPYVLHPVRVARLATEAARRLGQSAGTVQVIEVASILHDTVEDTSTSISEIARRFGDSVASLVSELTQDKRLAKAERRRLMIEHCGSMSLPARIVKLCDRLDNMQSLDSLGHGFIERYCDESEAMLERMRGTDSVIESKILAIVEQHREA
ncbi:HD domain-containing protein [Planctomycetota bacterium]